MCSIKITKMNGCGNDFVIVEYSEYEKTGLSMDEFARKLCDRHFGVGADGMIIPNLNHDDDWDISWYFYNSDGTTAQMCGNGMRCFAKYVYDKGLVKERAFKVKTFAGIIRPEIIDENTVRVDMGIPILEDKLIPFNGERKVSLKDKVFDITPVSMGNPHCVIFTEEDTMSCAKKYGPDMEIHPNFPEKTNTEFVRVISDKEIEMSVFERGCGITLACGTGACASVVASVLNNLTQQNVKVNLPGGAVNVEWQGNIHQTNEHIFLSGPAEYSFFADYML